MSDAFSEPVSASDLAALRDRSRRTLDRLRRELLVARQGADHWSGHLSSSALSTATAVSAMAAVVLDRGDPAGEARRGDRDRLLERIARGIDYLRGQQTDAGGFGDTDRSHANIATSYLVLAASTLSQRVGGPTLDAEQRADLERYLDRAGRLDGLRARYGKDKTFVVPIMNNLAIAGLIPWEQVAALPFEAAVFPQSMYRFLRMPVVSYAIPALVAIGQARHFLGPRSPWPLRRIRSLSVGPTLKVLRRMQPASGGYLEATPLTAFVVMSLAATGRSDLEVVRDGLIFLEDSMREDGSWPIDTNLATWVTSLAVHALSCDPDDDGRWCSDGLVAWHLKCQHTGRHPFTGAEPGGWGWTDLSGAVPDSDDTPAAMLALGRMRYQVDATRQREIDQAVERGTRWLLRLQNRNGGWPTFCRGWGKLPFDRSSTDLTAHALRALAGNREPGQAARQDVVSAARRGRRFLKASQRRDGSWLPLWFGNQDDPEESNPIYGTAKVLIAGAPDVDGEAAAIAFLLDQQQADGGWGGGPSLGPALRRIAARHAEASATGSSGNEAAKNRLVVPAGLISSVEETALAVEALCTVVLRHREAEGNSGRGLGLKPQTVTEGISAAGNGPLMAAILAGVRFLIQGFDDRRHQVSWPIGFYFAKLWYHEKLYPLIFSTAALGKFLRATAENHDPNWPV